MTLVSFSALLWHVVAVVFVIACFLLAVYFVVFEVRQSLRVWRIQHGRGGYIYDRDRERIGL